MITGIPITHGPTERDYYNRHGGRKPTSSGAPSRSRSGSSYSLFRHGGGSYLLVGIDDGLVYKCY